MSLLLFPTNHFCRQKRLHPFDDFFETINSLDKAFDETLRQKSMRIFNDKQQQSLSLTDDGLSLNVDVSSMKPEELRIRLEGDRLMIEGEHKKDNEQSSIHRRISYSFLIPTDRIDVSSLESTLNENGSLSICAPLIEKKKQLKGREIPIQIVSQQKQQQEQLQNETN